MEGVGIGEGDGERDVWQSWMVLWLSYVDQA